MNYEWQTLALAPWRGENAPYEHQCPARDGRELPAAIQTLQSKQTMKKLKGGWVEGSVQDFLNLSDADVEYIETRLALSRLFKGLRQKRRLTQVQVAMRLHTSQSRVAKMEKGDPTVSIDLMLQSLFRLGMKRKQLVAGL